MGWLFSTNELDWPYSKTWYKEVSTRFFSFRVPLPQSYNIWETDSSHSVLVRVWNGASRNLRSYRVLKCQAIFPPGGLTVPLISGCWSISFAAGVVGMCYLRQYSTTHHLGWRPLDLTRTFLPVEADSSVCRWSESKVVTNVNPAFVKWNWGSFLRTSMAGLGVAISLCDSSNRLYFFYFCPEYLIPCIVLILKLSINIAWSILRWQTQQAPIEKLYQCFTMYHVYSSQFCNSSRFGDGDSTHSRNNSLSLQVHVPRFDSGGDFWYLLWNQVDGGVPVGLVRVRIHLGRPRVEWRMAVGWQFWICLIILNANSNLFFLWKMNGTDVWNNRLVYI